MPHSMMNSMFFTVALCLLAAISINAEQTASFYGSSFASLVLQDSSSGSGVDTRFRFKTRSEDALLLLAASGADYCIIELKRGTLKVRLKLASISKEFSLGGQERCNDLRWHEVMVFYKSGHNVSIALDQQYTTHQLPVASGALSSLDHPGQKTTIYVGSLGGYAGPLSTGRPPNFRGCLESLYYNNINVFHRVQANKKTSGGVLYELEFEHRCPTLFEASNSDAISFTDAQQSFIALPTLPDCSQGLQLNMQFQSSMSRGLLAYQSGRRSVLALELDDGRVNLLFKFGGELHTLTSPHRVTDAHWHKLQVELQANGSVVFYVDTNKITWDANSTRSAQTLNDDCSFDTHFYVGGVDAKNRARAQAQGVKPFQYSLAGCVHYMRLNSKPIGLEDALVTKAVSKDCVWKYPCLKEPCLPEADCLQVGIDSFQCVCDKKICTKKSFTANYKETYATSADEESPSENVLAVTPVVVHDGGVEHLSPEHIQLLVDLPKLGLRPGDIHFTVLVGPNHGMLSNERVKTDSEVTTFTYRDISRYRVVYTHDGSETANDTVVLEMSVEPSTLLLQRLPKALLEKMQFMLHIAILTPQNSPSSHSYDSQATLTLARLTKKLITNELLKVDDVQFVDESAAKFMVHIEDPENTGFVDNFKNPGQPIEGFTFQEMKQNTIWFNHRGNSTSTSFGLTYSSPAQTKELLIEVRTFPLEIRMLNNTGVQASYLTPTIMTNQMLAFVTNAPEQGLDIRFDMIQLPKYGTIQRLKNNSVWTNTSHFSQRQLTRHKVRYVPIPRAARDQPLEDNIGFVVSCEKAKLSTQYAFRLNFTTDRIFVTTNNTRIIHDTKQITLTERDLKYVDGAEARITYTLTATPKLGKLLLNGVVLTVGSNFTQRHLAQRNLVYRPSKSVIFFEDTFKFNVFSSGSSTSLLGQTFTLRSANSDSLIVANMRVPEGERLALKLAKPAHKNKYTVKISGHPKHGSIERSESNAFHAVLEFPTEDVGNGQIFYKHDDSESMHDKVIYELYKDNATEPFQEGEVNIDISLKNDNPPKRTQEQVFHIAYQAEKILSNIYLRYEDADTDTDPSKISISRKEIPNAMLVRNDDSRKEVQQFTQKDIDDEMILVRHTGGDYGRAIFWVSDGQFYATGILEIVASPPYLNITTNTGLLLEQGSSALLLPSNLSLDTNLNVKPSEVVFEVKRPPSLGKLRFAQSSDEFIDKFTLRDIQEGIIEYVHLSSNKNAHNDVFGFVAVALGVRKEDSFKITVYPTTFWTPMELRAGGGNQTLFLDVGSTITVSRTYLNVVHETLEPEDIVFTLIRKPHSGKLQMEGKATSKFTQADVNKGKLKYAHSAQAGPDSFVVDVTNGFSQMTGIEVRFGAVLREISLRTQNFTVDEGSKVTLTVEYLSLPAETGSLDVISEYLIIEPPKHGAIVSKSKDVVNSFQPIQLQKGEIEYDHNGDESLVDFFTVIGRASAMGKETAPATIHVKVQPVNDEVPQVVENSGLELWEGEWAIISSDHLAVIDEDTPPEDLRFILTQPPSNGFVAVNNRMQPVLSFTQAEINRNVIVFTHTGAEAGGFKFQVDDGVNTLSGQQFIVRAKEITVDVSRNEKLRVEPRGQQSITTDHLQAVSSLPLSNTNAQIIYTLIEPPKFGRIVREQLDGTLEAIQEFTQAEIDQTLVLYENTAPTKNDSFTFSVSTNKGKLNLKSHIFTIDVSPKSIIDSPVVVQAKEGDLVALKNEVLALGRILPKANVTVIRQPSHGWIGLDGPKGVEPTETFTDDDISHGRVWYNHDDSETFEDKFVVSVQRLDKTAAEPLNISIFVEIAPVNDQPPVLKTESPSVEIVEGQSTTLTSEILYTEDADNMTSQIVYNLEYTDLVTFVKNDSNPVWTFTQQDVDELRISVSCNNTEANAIFEIKFQVDDGMSSAQKAVLTVTVRPPSLNMAKNSEVILTQGSFYREITTFELDVDTDSKREECWYDVVQPPENGHVHAYGNNTTLFRQEDVDMGNVQYVQVNNMSATEDFFIVDVHCQSSTLKGVRVNVSVIALVNQERLLEVPLNSRGIIGKRHLDATKIATKHQSNPRYHITRKPLNGIIGKVGFGPVDQFSHEDVLNSLVYYQSRSGDAPSEDSFEFKLCSPGVQPGKGQLIIVITRPVGSSEPPSTTQSVLPTIEVPIASTTSVSLLELDRSQMHQVILLLSLVFIAVIVITIAFAILLCKVVRMSSSSSCKSQGGASNSSTYVSNSGFLEQDEVDRFIAQAAPPPPPQCRVTPMLEPVILDYTSSLQEMSLPDCASGNEETDSKEGATSSPIPVLRKNQYWV